MATGYTEDHQVEQPAIDLFNHLGWKTVNAYEENLATTESTGTLGRETRNEVVLTAILKSKLKEFNPNIPKENLDEVIKEFTQDRSSMHPVRANKEIYDLIREGVDVEFRGTDGMLKQETVKIVDWKQPEENDFLLVSQLWVKGDYGNKRPDLVGFVNGLPLLLFELKKPARPVEEAFNGNISDYKDTIPQLFWYNQFIFLSNGVDTKIGTISSPWEFYTEWKKISDEEEPGIVSLETAIRGICEKNRLLDLLEHFILFENIVSKPKKLMARNHQYLGVNNAIEAVKSIGKNKGRLGVFWHTQGSGKSYSMALLTRKIMRSIPGDWKFVIVTDRLDLDEQIYKNFAGVGAVTEPESEVRADNKEQLKQLLQENHRYTFTLIHKFHSRDGEEFPLLSEDDDIIVITDEAHRTQYDTLAMNMRKALPNASFLGFTGTPLIKGEDEKTREVFGDYVSIYDFKQSIEDNATVPLFYKNRIPELELSNEHLNEELQQLLEDAMLNEAQEEKLAREFRQEYHLITRKDRLETIAKDVVQHFLNRGFMGKGMMVCIDRFTTVRMYELVQKEWKAEEERVKEKLSTADKLEQDQLLDRLKFLRETDMAVVISKSQNEIKEFDDVGLDIRPHRIRLEKEPLDEKFKDDEDPLRLVFVCAMWITGFSVSSLSTLYLDKPMKSHTLMQTIARANRVFEGKNNGMIVDYVGVFRHLQDALAVYATGPDSEDSTVPVKNKEELIQQLREAIKLAEVFCERQGVDLQKIIDAEGFDKSKYQDEFAKAIIEYKDLDEEVNNAADKVLINEEMKKAFIAHSRTVNQLYKAILPDPKAGEFLPVRSALKAISDLIKRLGPSTPDDMSSLYVKIEEKLDESIHSKSYVIDGGSDAIDLSNIDFEKLKKEKLVLDWSNYQSRISDVRVTIEKELDSFLPDKYDRALYAQTCSEFFDHVLHKY